MTAAAPSDLAEQRRALAGTTLAELFARDPRRFDRLSLAWDGWLVDLSKERLGADTLPLLIAHADAAGLPGWIRALFAGEKVNQSERKPALHTALRQTGDLPLVVEGRNIIPDIRAAQSRMRMRQLSAYCVCEARGSNSASAMSPHVSSGSEHATSSPH